MGGSSNERKYVASDCKNLPEKSGTCALKKLSRPPQMMMQDRAEVKVSNPVFLESGKVTF
jgi:hypothetical protein